MFYDYRFPSQPDPIPVSLIPDYVTSAPNISYAEGSNDAVGIQLLANANVSFAIRFLGAHSNPARRTKFRAQSQRCRDDVTPCGQDRRS